MAEKAVPENQLHHSYVKDIAELLEKQGYKVITEGSIPKFRNKEWGEPDLFILKKQGAQWILDKIIEVTICDVKEGASHNSVESKCKKIKEYYNPPELVVFEPTGFTSLKYREDLMGFKDYDEFNEHLHNKWSKQGLNVIFWNDWNLEELKKT